MLKVLKILALGVIVIALGIFGLMVYKGVNQHSASHDAAEYCAAAEAAMKKGEDPYAALRAVIGDPVTAPLRTNHNVRTISLVEATETAPRDMRYGMLVYGLRDVGANIGDDWCPVLAEYDGMQEQASASARGAAVKAQ